MPNFTGFDSLAYPGAGMMQWLKDNTNLSFCGFYLAPAPSRPDSEWMGRRATLVAQGWGFAPVYVGQQQADVPNCPHDLTAARGATDGQDALNLMGQAGEGFPIGSTVYLDLERPEAPTQGMLDYFAAWVDTVNASGTYRAGLYAPYRKAPPLLAVRTVPVWVVQIVDPAPSMTPPFAQYDPAASKVPTAVAWQYVIDTDATFPGAPKTTWTVDLDCAVVSDPSNLASTAIGAMGSRVLLDSTQLVPAIERLVLRQMDSLLSLGNEAGKTDKLFPNGITKFHLAVAAGPVTITLDIDGPPPLPS